MPAAANLRSCQDSRKKPRESPNTSGRISTTSGISVAMKRMSGAPVGDLEQVLPVATSRQRARQALELCRVDVAAAKRDLLRAADLQPLAALERLDEHRRPQQRLVRAGVQPGDPAAEELDVQRAALEVRPVDVGDLQLATRGGRERGGDLEHRVVV